MSTIVTVQLDVEGYRDTPLGTEEAIFELEVCCSISEFTVIEPAMDELVPVEADGLVDPPPPLDDFTGVFEFTHGRCRSSPSP
jgi:hypothetical protein